MDRISKKRALTLLVLFALILGLFGFRMYGLQIRDADPNAGAAASTYTTWSRVTAARGDILDRNGNVLVSNRASYNLVFNNFVLFNGENPNESLRRLAALLWDQGIDYIEHFPVTWEKPYTYTLSDQSTTWRGYFKDFLNHRDWDSDISASQLIKLLRQSYNLPNDWTDQEIRQVIGLRYELELRAGATNLSAYTLIQDVSSEHLAAIRELNTPGLMVETGTVREYNTDYAAHILGRVGPMDSDEYKTYSQLGYAMDARVGKEGLERAFESYLHGTDGTKITTVSADGEIISEYFKTKPVAGNNVELTIDIGIQKAVEDSLAQVILDLRENGLNSDGDGKDAEGGAVVVMNVKTGEILACASYPTFRWSTFEQDYERLKTEQYDPFYNRALLGTYAPGSVFKMAVAIAAIDSGKITKLTPVEDKGVYTKYADTGYAPQCLIWTNRKQTHGSINVEQALAVSCNYFFYEVGEMAGVDAIDNVAKALGLGEATGIELEEYIGHRANPETKAKIYSDPKESHWFNADTVALSIGQSECRFTPLQLCVYTCALANRGVRYRATFLSRVVSSDYKTLIQENEPEILSRLNISEEAYEAYTEGMRMAVNSPIGTVYSRLNDYKVAVAAKTGTAQHGSGGSDNGSFVCYAPYDDPEIAVAVFVEKGAQGGNLAQIAEAAMDVYFGNAQTEETVPNENVPS